MLDNPSLTSQKINTQIEKLNDAKNKLIETLKAKLNGKNICFMNNVNNHNFVTNNQLNNHYRMSFIAILKIKTYLMIFIIAKQTLLI